MGHFKAAVIGLGRIGLEFDYTGNDDSLVLTHSSGFYCHPAYELVAGVDPDPVQRKKFERKFKKPAYSNINAMFSVCLPNVVSIGIPTELHFKVFQEVMGFDVKAVLCEKPLSFSVEEGKCMVEMAQKKGTSLLVDYMRRFEPGVLRMKESISNGQIGEVYKGTVWYSKGLLNNGSHYIDLLRFLLGEVKGVSIINNGRKWENEDPEPDVKISFGNSDIFFLSAREECFTLIEMELVGSKGKLKYSEGGRVIEMKTTEPDPVFPGYTVLSKKNISFPTDFVRHQWHVLDHLFRHLENNEPLYSDGASALETLKVVDSIFSLIPKN